MTNQSKLFNADSALIAQSTTPGFEALACKFMSDFHAMARLDPKAAVATATNMLNAAKAQSAAPIDPVPANDKGPKEPTPFKQVLFFC